MTRRRFLRNAAIATVAAPAIPAAVARVTAPGAMLFTVDFHDIMWKRASFNPCYDFIGGRAQCEAFRRMWENGMKKYYDTR